MKNLVLDDIMHDELHSLLKKNERVIWEGKPSTKLNWKFYAFGKPISSAVSNIISWILLLFFGGWAALFFIALIWDTSLQFKVIIGLSFLSFLFTIYLRGYEKRNTKYIVSNERILFQFWKRKDAVFQSWKLGYLEFFSIPFSEINDIVIIEETPKKGVIFLAVKNPKDIPFDTHNFSNGERRHQPTLELIEDVKEVGDYIRKGIRGKL